MKDTDDILFCKIDGCASIKQERHLVQLVQRHGHGCERSDVLVARVERDPGGDLREKGLQLVGASVPHHIQQLVQYILLPASYSPPCASRIRQPVVTGRSALARSLAPARSLALLWSTTATSSGSSLVLSLASGHGAGGGGVRCVGSVARCRLWPSCRLVTSPRRPASPSVTRRQLGHSVRQATRTWLCCFSPTSALIHQRRTNAMQLSEAHVAVRETKSSRSSSLTIVSCASGSASGSASDSL